MGSIWVSSGFRGAGGGGRVFPQGLHPLPTQRDDPPLYYFEIIFNFGRLTFKFSKGALDAKAKIY